MRKWGIVVTLVYAVIVIGLLTPALLRMGGVPWSDLRQSSATMYSQWPYWVFAGAFVTGQAMLLFLSVDTSHKRLKPRTHLLASCVTAALFTAVLAASTFWSLGVAAKGEAFINTMDKFRYGYGLLTALWVLWAAVFYLYLRNASAVVTRLTSWLLKGSVLELLIAVPCHVIVRRRNDCSAPVVSGFGIASGIAIMLMSFGPGILLLYKKRLDAYSERTNSPSQSAKGAGS